MEDSLRKNSIDTTSAQTCAVCHFAVNEMSFPFMKFDTVGRFAPQDVGGEMDVSSRPVTSDGTQQPLVDGQPELIRHVAQEPSSRKCFVRRWVHYQLGREASQLGAEHEAAEASIDKAHKAFEASGGNIKELMKSLVLTPLVLQK